MENAKLVAIGVFLMFTAGVVNAGCEDIESEVMQGEAHEAAGMWETAAKDYGSAASCYDYVKDYDNAIKYEKKAAEMFEKSGIMGSVAAGNVLIAKYYSKKGEGNEDEIREHCEIGEQIFLEEINKQLQRDKPLYAAISSHYESLADCYKLIDDREKSCEHCAEMNKYGEKAGYDPKDCKKFYKCSTSSGGTNGGNPGGGSGGDSGGGTSGGGGSGGGGELPVTWIAIGAVVLIVIAGATWFFMKR